MKEMWIVWRACFFLRHEPERFAKDLLLLKLPSFYRVVMGVFVCIGR